MSNESLGFLVQELTPLVVATHVEAARQLITEDLGAVQNALTGSVPVLSGRLRSSVLPYIGKPPTEGPAADQPFFPIHGEDEVFAIMQRWQPGDDVGIVSNTPYSIVVLLEGHSKKFPEGQFDLVVDQALSGEGR